MILWKISAPLEAAIAVRRQGQHFLERLPPHPSGAVMAFLTDLAVGPRLSESVFGLASPSHPSRQTTQAQSNFRSRYPQQHARCVFRTNVTGFFGIMTGISGTWPSGPEGKTGVTHDIKHEGYARGLWPEEHNRAPDEHAHD